MKLCNQTVTVFNARYEPDWDYTIYEPTVLKGVSWYSTIKSTVTDKGLKAANQTVVRIPEDVNAGGKRYAAANGYTGQSDWTLSEGDLLALGAVSLNDPTLADIHKSSREVITILGVTDNRRAPNAPHWKVVGA